MHTGALGGLLSSRKSFRRLKHSYEAPGSSSESGPCAIEVLQYV
jgi:hypothetical protein